jgi:hypothetical protein
MSRGCQAFMSQPGRTGRARLRTRLRTRGASSFLPIEVQHVREASIDNEHPNSHPYSFLDHGRPTDEQATVIAIHERSEKGFRLGAEFIPEVPR